MATNSFSLLFGTTLDGHAKLSTNATLKNMSTFTWMAWVKVNSSSDTTQYKRAYVERQGTGAGIRFACTPMKGRLRFEFSPKDGTPDTNYDYLYTWDDRWHHVAFIGRVSGTPSYEIYLDGNKVASGTLVVPAGTTAISNTTPLGSIYVANHSLHTTGGETFPSDRYWKGSIDEIIIFNTAKNQSDITTYYGSNNTWATSDPDMFSYWQFDAGSGTTTADTKNGAWTGTLYNGATPTALWTADRPFLGNGTLDTTVPSTPTLGGTPTTGISTDGFTATWGASTDNIFVQSYELHVSQFSNFSSFTTYSTTALTQVVTGLLPGVNYYWRASALDARNNRSGYTATQSLTTLGSADLTAPLPPTALNATNKTSTSFRVNYTQSASSDETGYKIDVSPDAKFVNYLDGYRNKDVGNVVFTDVFGAKPLTTYYVRLRAYDAADNESVESTVLAVQTLQAPDSTPPLEVELFDPTSVTADAFTANWNTGIDDIGVASYRLDLAFDSGFTSFVTAEGVVWNNVNVGNVTSYRLTDLLSETAMFYRVRAVDGAGNISPNPASGMQVQTDTPSINEGGYVNTIVYPTHDSYTDSTATSANYGAATSMTVLGTGAANSFNAFLRFPVSGLPGTIASAVLYIYISNASAGSFSVNVGTTAFDEMTLTWANQPSIAGTTISFNPSLLNQYVAIDIGSLLTAGMVDYTVKISTLSTDGIVLHSKEGANPPYLEIEADPTSATLIDPDFIFVDKNGTITNSFTNPSFEGNSTTGWVGVKGSGAGNPATLSISATAYGGTKACQVVCDGTIAFQGIQNTATAVVAAQGQRWTCSFWLRHVSGITNLAAYLHETDASGTVALADSTVLNFTAVTGQWKRYTLSGILTNASTARISVIIGNYGTTAATTFVVDNLILTGGAADSPQFSGYFDGDTPSAWWTGTVYASTSQMALARFTFDSTYTGDSDGDNSVVAYIKPTTDSEWMATPDLQTVTSNNRVTKRASTASLASLPYYNPLPNPGFEIDTYGWLAFVSGGTSVIARDTTESYLGDASLSVTVSATADIGAAASGVLTPAAPSEVWNARLMMKGPVGLVLRLYIFAYNSSSTYLGNNTPVVGVGELTMDGTWMEAQSTYTMPASTAYCTLGVYTGNTVGGVFYLDNGQLSKTYMVPYRDGSFADAVWEGLPYKSATSVVFLPTTSYDVMHTYTDPDGVVNEIGATTSSLGGTHVSVKAADNMLGTNVLSLAGELTSVVWEMNYDGDDDNDMTVVVDWRRTDLTNWASVVPIYDRINKRVYGTIENLKMGTSYTVRLTATDPDGINGTNPITAVVVTASNYGSPEAQSVITFGGFVLMGREDGKIGVIEHDSFGLPERRVQVEILPRVDGAVELQNLWGKRPISLRGFVEGDTRGELEDNKNALKRALAPKLQQLVIDTLSSQGRFFYATCESLAIAEAGGENIRHLIWEADFVCADPFSYDSALTVIPEISVANGGTISATNLGDLRVDPLLKIRTAHIYPVTLTVLNNTTGERFVPSATIINGDRLVIDTAKLIVLKNGVEIDYSGSFPHLTVGANEFAFSLTTTSGTPTVLPEISWRHRYL